MQNTLLSIAYYTTHSLLLTESWLPQLAPGLDFRSYLFAVVSFRPSAARRLPQLP